MLTVSESLIRVLSHFRALNSESVPLGDCPGRVLANEVRSTLHLPPFPNSSMDGFAVRAADLLRANESPVSLMVIGDIPAGSNPSSFNIVPGTAARIMTGAPMPAGADAVVPIEDTDAFGKDEQHLPPAVEIRREVRGGDYVRGTGEDVRAGDVVLPAGHRVRPYDIGLLAAVGQVAVEVVRRPRVAILATGDELVGIELRPGVGQIRDSNSHTLKALTASYGGEPLLLGVARDNVQAVSEKLEQAVALAADVIVSSAGVSVGAYDVVRTAVQQAGALDFWKVRMRPGKPLAFGQYRGIPFFGLPGNPVSSVVGFELFVRPAILKMSGRENLQKPLVWARVEEELHSDGRESYLRATVEKVEGQYFARSAGGQGSNILSALSKANALLIVPEGVRAVARGSMLQAWMLDWPEEVF